MVSRRGEAGFALQEVIVSIALLAIVMSFAFAGESGHLRHAAKAFEETVANHIASSRLERLRGDTDLDLREGVAQFDVPTNERLVAPHGRQITRRIEPGLFEVTAEVSWLPAGANRRRTIRLTTLLRREDER